MTTSQTNSSHHWAHRAINKLNADSMRSADTHLHRLPLPAQWGIQLYLKDESTHLTGSLKHRLARSLFLYGLVNGWIREGMTMVEASSGSTAISEAYFAQLLGLKFISVVPASTSPEKIALIKMRGGECHFVENGAQMYSAAETLAAETGGYYLDQFTNAARATDWRGNNNIAETIFQQLSLEPNPVPEWIVVGAGTGGTSATIGRYARYKCHDTRLVVVDPENSAFLPGWEAHDPGFTTGRASRIEGIGRPRMEPSFIPEVVDEMIQVPDGASIAAMRHLTALTGLRSGPSTGTNLWGVWQLVARMLQAGDSGSIVSLLCDSAERYACTYYNDDWLLEHGLDPSPYTGVIEELFTTGRWRL